jgi:hypothetical protein
MAGFSPNPERCHEIIDRGMARGIMLDDIIQEVEDFVREFAAMDAAQRSARDN